MSAIESLRYGLQQVASVGANPMIAAAIAEYDALAARLAEAERDAERLDWIERNLIEGKWDGTIGRPKSWQMIGPYRYVLQTLRGNTFREALDAAMEQSHE